MPEAPDRTLPPLVSGLGRGEPYYRAMLRRTLVQSLLFYIVPLSLIVGYFLIQYRTLAIESRRVHLQAIAESQALTLDLFLRERVVDLSNLMDDLEPHFPPTEEYTARCLETLKTHSGAFEELAFFDHTGTPLAYAGPFGDLESRDYGEEAWFQTLLTGEQSYIITDDYQGFREQPHFGIAVKRRYAAGTAIARAVIFPGTIQEYLISVQYSGDTRTIVVDENGRCQVCPPTEDGLLTTSPFVPPVDVPIGVTSVEVDGEEIAYAFAWIKTTGWALIVHQVEGGGAYTPPVALLALTFLFLLLGCLALYLRARATVRHEREMDQTEADLSGQLVRAAKLASVGELAAGIAHEINNPLAIIAEEVGLIQDLKNPEFRDSLTPKRLDRHLANIHDATFRCRDITRKLLGFVRQEEVKLEEADVQEILDGVVDGMLGSSISVTNVKVIKDYSLDLPRIVTDRGQLEHVFLNLVKNALDAMRGEGTLILHTSRTETGVAISVTDTGCGMSPETLERIFVPFFTTKEVGKGTGLGLSVSLGIVHGLGGQIFVSSKVGQGSRFTVDLPLQI